MQVKIVLNYFQKRPENPNENILLLKEMEDLKNDIKPSQISQEKYEDQIKEQLQNMVAEPCRQIALPPKINIISELDKY